MYGTTVNIDPRTIDLKASPVNTAPWKLWFRSLMWVAPLAAQSYEAGDADGAAIVAAYVAAAVRTSTDPGSATSSALARAIETGWDEGTNLRREQLLNCLALVQRDAAVNRWLDEAIAANLDQNRYYGLPFHHPHNHGVMANIALIDTAAILGRDSLIDAAESRLYRDVQSVLDKRCGMTFEQSAAYHGFNVRMWRRAADHLEAARHTARLVTIRAAADQMAVAYDHLVAPDGRVAAVGDSSPNRGFFESSHATTRMLCPTAGWAAGRTSWTSTATHYTLRFGPARGMHGQNDHGSVTWANGDEVLVDPGYYYDTAADAGRWATSNAAHNVLGVAGVEFSGATSLQRSAWATSADTFAVRDVASSVTRTRSIRVDRTLPLLTVLDRGTSGVTRTFSQRWHFDPQWQTTKTPGRLTNGRSFAGVVALDLRTGRELPVATASALVFPTSTTTARAPVLWFTTRATSAAIFTVVYRTTTGARPVLRWLPGATAGTGTVRVHWGRTYRDVRIDLVGIRA
jgi:hypothetical protein